MTFVSIKNSFSPLGNLELRCFSYVNLPILMKTYISDLHVDCGSSLVSIEFGISAEGITAYALQEAIFSNIERK